MPNDWSEQLPASGQEPFSDGTFFTDGTGFTPVVGGEDDWIPEAPLEE